MGHANARQDTLETNVMTTTPARLQVATAMGEFASTAGVSVTQATRGLIAPALTDVTGWTAMTMGIVTMGPAGAMEDIPGNTARTMMNVTTPNVGFMEEDATMLPIPVNVIQAITDTIATNVTIASMIHARMERLAD